MSTVVHHLLVKPDLWGRMSAEQALDYSETRHSVFPCGRCSTAQVQVYHNVFGRHCHVEAGRLAEMVQQVEDLDKGTTTPPAPQPSPAPGGAAGVAPTP